METTLKMRDAKTGRMRKVRDGLDNTRIRFNWGYHDAAQEQQQGMARPDGLTKSTIRDKHFDPAYAYGWVEGWNDAEAGEYKGNSEAAWVRSNKRAYLTQEYAPYRKIA